MASLRRLPSGTFHIHFRFGGKKYKRSLRTDQLRKAMALKAKLEETIDLVVSRRLDLPDSVDEATFRSEKI